MTRWICTLIAGLMLSLPSAHAQDPLPLAVFIDAGDTEGLIEAVNRGNDGTGPGLIFIRPPVAGGDSVFEFENSDGAGLPPITSNIDIYPANQMGSRITFRPVAGEAGSFPLLEVKGEGRLELGNFIIDGFGNPDGSGGAITVGDSGRLRAGGVEFRNNAATGNGGAVLLTGNASGAFSNCRFTGNRASQVGGGISIEGSATGGVSRCVFDENRASVFGCDLNLSSSSVNAFRLYNSTLTSSCDNVLLENPLGRIYASGNTFAHPSDGIDSTDLVRMFGNVFLQTPGSSPQVVTPGQPKPKAMCNDFGSGAFESLGYNLSSDDSCALDQASDQPNTDPMIVQNEAGTYDPLPGSPVIDAGASEIMEPEPGELAVLPCGYVDHQGTGRPQDGNGDGVFECDSGAAEVAGAGAVSEGHSGAFYNVDRNGEGNYVEILTPGIALVYTFTFRPDGSGPAWFTGVGTINGNSIVIDDLQRPIGTSFGDGFEADEIDFTPAGGMSMVFPNCRAGGNGGGVAYSGDETLGYEGLLSRATRISQITGCNFTPGVNAGLSGSFYDPARNGEGLIVEWLDNGDVLAIFFTYDTQGNQFWVFGVGTPDGKSVTINALYPESSTAWGRAFDPDDVTLSSWGTFDLTWTACSAMTFSYSSTVSGYGSATRNYQRVTTLAGTSCPDF